MRKTYVSTMVVSSICLLITSCGPDQNQQQYQNSLTQKYLAAQARAAGDSVGIATLKSDSSTVGAVKLHVASYSDAQPSSDNLTQATRATMSWHVTISGFSTGENAQFTFAPAAYNSDNHTITGTSPVSDLSSANPAKTVQAHLTGTLSDGGAFDGYIEVDGQEANAIHIHTDVVGSSQANSASVPQVQTSGLRYVQYQLTEGYYAGMGTMPGQNGAPSYASKFSLSFQQTDTSDQDRFAELMFTQRPVAISVSHTLPPVSNSTANPGAMDPVGGVLVGGTTAVPVPPTALRGNPESFSGTVVEQDRSLHLSAIGPAEQGGAKPSIACNSQVYPNNILGWHCVYTSSQGTTSLFDAIPSAP